MKDFKTSTSDNFATIEIGLAKLPSERYKRNVVRGALDLVGNEKTILPRTDYTEYN